jgi:hypothetical protein
MNRLDSSAPTGSENQSQDDPDSQALYDLENDPCYNRLAERVGLQLAADLARAQVEHHYENETILVSHHGFRLAVRRYANALRFAALYTNDYVGLYELTLRQTDQDTIVFQTCGTSTSSDWSLQPGNNPFSLTWVHCSTRDTLKKWDFTLIGDKTPSPAKPKSGFASFAAEQQKLLDERLAAEAAIDQAGYPEPLRQQALERIRDQYEKCVSELGATASPNRAFGELFDEFDH